ncbi:ABC transporter permease subunit [Phaeospirillum tilakii]|uniref:ABC transporter permease subunit n=1 Tax=Phaeospirillum tilakii TaxID=741673 RepID=A0ABW5CER9_9PROT
MRTKTESVATAIWASFCRHGGGYWRSINVPARFRRQIPPRIGCFLAALMLVVLAMPLPAGAGDPARPNGQALAGLTEGGGRIGAVLGTLFVPYLQQAHPHAALTQLNTNADLVVALKSGKLDAAVFDSISAEVLLKTNPDLAVLDRDFLVYPLGIGFGQNRADLRARFDRFLDRIRADGRYAAIHRRWFIDDPEQAVMPDDRPAAPTERAVLGVAIGDMPYVAMQNGRYVGFDIEILRRFAADENIALEIQALDFGALIPALKSGKLDMIADGLAITEERRKAIDFSAPYGEGRAVALTLKSRLGAGAAPTEPGAGWTRFTDLAHARIAVIEGTAQDIFVTKTLPEATIVRFNSKADYALALRTGKVEAGLQNEMGNEAILAENPDLAVLDNDFLNTHVGAAFRKGDGALVDRFNAFLAASEADGSLAAIKARWLQGDARKATMPDLPTADGPVLRVGTAPVVALPFVAVANGRYIGFDMELVARFAALEGRRLEIVPLEFTSLIAALAAGKIDMIVSNLSITPERALRVDFSRPYFDERTVAVVARRNLAASHPAATAAPPAVTEPARPTDWRTMLEDSLHANFVTEQRWKLILDGLGATVVISVAATLFGTLLGAGVCYLRMSARRPLRAIGIGYIGLVRGLPVLLLLMLIFYVVFAAVNIDPLLVAVVAFGMNFAAYVSEMFRTGIEGIERGQTEAGLAMGFTRAETFLRIVLPQATRRVLPVYRGEFISLVKMTSIVGYIGVQDLTKAGDIIRSRTFEAFFPLLMVAAIYFLIIWVLGLALDHIDRRTDPRQRQAKGARA